MLNAYFNLSMFQETVKCLVIIMTITVPLIEALLIVNYQQ